MSKENQKMIAYIFGAIALIVIVYYLGKHMNWWGEEKYALLGPSAKEYTYFLSHRLRNILYNLEKKVESNINKTVLIYLSNIVDELENNNYAGIRKMIDFYNKANNIRVESAKESKYEDDLKEADEAIESGKLPAWARL
jgi:hypothetical protein